MSVNIKNGQPRYKTVRKRSVAGKVVSRIVEDRRTGERKQCAITNLNYAINNHGK